MNRPITLLALTASLAHGGCVNSLTRGPWEQLTVESDPPGAEVRLSNGVTGTTPVRFGVPRREDLTVTLSKEGYHTTIIRTFSQIDALGAMNELPAIIRPDPAGILLGVADLGTGSGSSHRPNPVRVKLRPVAPEANDSTPGPQAKVRP